MNYKISYVESIFDQLSSIPSNIRKTIVRAIDERLATNPYSVGKQLKSELAGCYRLRVGDYRIIYQINKKDSHVLIIKIAPRGKVYK